MCSNHNEREVDCRLQKIVQIVYVCCEYIFHLGLFIDSQQCERAFGTFCSQSATSVGRDGHSGLGLFRQIIRFADGHWSRLAL